MKKFLLFVATAFVTNATFAQSSLQLNSGNINPCLHNVSGRTSEEVATAKNYSPLAKSTGLSDTLYRASNAQLDSLFNPGGKLYYMGATLPYDSGYIFGTNPMAFSGFAGWYRGQYQPDTTLKILGVIALFGGNYNSATTKTINFKIWGVDTASITVSTTRKVRDLPKTTNVMGQMSRSIKTIGIGPGSVTDTIKDYYFPTAISNVNTNFYAGYDINYNWAQLAGDTIGVYSTGIGSGWGSGFYYVSGPDTIIYAQTAIYDGTTWKDALVSYGLNSINISIVPIFQYSGAGFWPSEVGGISRNNLTYWGHYPNPSTDKVNIKFALENGTSVSLLVRDITGKTVISVPATKYEKGEHIINFETAQLPAGNYVYMIQTKEGDAMAAQVTVVK